METFTKTAKEILDFIPKGACILTGDNGSGKTQILKRIAESEGVPVHCFSDPSGTAAGESPLRDASFLKADGRNLPSFLARIRRAEPKSILRMEGNIAAVVPGFGRFSVTESGDSAALQYVDAAENPHELSDLSSGSLRYAALTALLMQRPLPRIILVDEPETGLGNDALIHVAAMANSAAALGTTVIMATHSPFLTDTFGPEAVIRTERTETGRTSLKKFSRDDMKRWEDGEGFVPMSELAERGILDCIEGTTMKLN